MTQSERKSASAPSRRAYNSPRRAAQASETRARISAAARDSFLAQGFTKTRMRDVAKRAQVSEATLYLAFPTKATLLADVIRSAIRGPASATRLADSPDWQTLTSMPTDQLLGHFAALIERILHDVAPLLAIGDAAASDNPHLRELRDRGRAAEHATFKTVAEALHARGALATHLSVERATDILYALASDTVYQRLTSDRSWSRDDYIAWLTDTLNHTLLGARPQADQGATCPPHPLPHQER
jgi:AcrR family transcriptional regulator